VADAASTRTATGGRRDDAAGAGWNQEARGETEEQRLDRNLAELLQELRVAQTGVQILFAFLLTIPFQQRFAEVTDVQRDLYLATLVTTVLATCLLIAPVSFHRLVFRRRLKDEVVVGAHWMAQGGLLLMGLAVLGALALVLDVVVGGTATWAVVGVVAGWFLLFWYVIPLARRWHQPDPESSDG
jgi:hypothetical protein